MGENMIIRKDKNGLRIYIKEISDEYTLLHNKDIIQLIDILKKEVEDEQKN